MARKTRNGNKPSYTPGVEFNDSDKLFLFIQKMRELHSRRFYKGLSLEVDPQHKQVRLHRVDDPESSDAFILTFRHFWEPSSPIEVNKIAGIFKRVAKMLNDDADLVRTLDSIDDEFRNSPEPGFMIPQLDNQSKMFGAFHLLTYT